MKLGTLIFIAAGGALLAAAIWLSRSSSPGLLLPESAPQVNQPNSYALLQATQSKHYNHEGKLAYSYKAASMEYFRPAISPTHEQDYSLVQLPQLTFFGDGLPWFIDAKEGKITDQGDTLEVWGDVRVWQVNAEGKQTLLTTQSLTIRPRVHEISTPDAVAIQSPTGTMGAQGLTVNLDTQTLKLHSKVKGTHAPVRTR
ncbi:MAG: LPS export ABC transporter periplasmic protein LptC [Moraxellaceae bacterium]|jgi:lipopolysaccharide export system protein LptC|nr:MAG: LPS export ABC transporter periplasmic protein LptC [Moraxellaceae bacterium]